MSLFEMCLLRVCSAHTPRQVVAWVPQDVLEKLVAPLRDWKHPRNVTIRNWLADTPTKLSLRGRFEVRHTKPARTVRALADCDDLVLHFFDVTELSHAVFKNLTRLHIHDARPDMRSLLNIDAIEFPSLHTLGLILHAELSTVDTQTLLGLLNTRTVRRCKTLGLRLISDLPLKFSQPIADFPIRHRKSQADTLILSTSCLCGDEMKLLNRMWTNTIHTLIVRVGDMTHPGNEVFESVRTLGLLGLRNLRDVATLCALRFPCVEEVAVVCNWNDDTEVLPEFFREATSLYFGDGHRFNRGNPDLRVILK